MLKTLKAVLKDESGVTMIEYGLIAALVAVAALAAVTNLGTGLGNLFGTVLKDLGAGAA